MSKVAVSSGARSRGRSRAGSDSGALPAPMRVRVTDETLLDAAVAVFAAAGFDRANMEVIAARAGVTKPTLYARLGSKEQVFIAAAEREYELRKRALFAAYDDEPVASRSFREQLHVWTAAYFDLVRDRPQGFRLLTEAERHPECAAVIERASHDIIARIAEIVRTVSKRKSQRGAYLVAAMIAGMLSAGAREAVSMKRVDFDRAAVLCESFLYGAVRGLDPDLIDAIR